MPPGFLLLAAVLLSSPLMAARWTVRVEEPTGLYRRTNEIVAIPRARLNPAQTSYLVRDPSGREVPHQLTVSDLLFPVSVFPGRLPVYEITEQTKPRSYPAEVTVRKLGLNRVELGNSRFRVVIDLAAGAIVEAYNLSAGPQRAVNLVETTPEDPSRLKGDIHATAGASALPASPVTGENAGWTSLTPGQPITRVEILEDGPLRARVQLSRGAAQWDLWFDAFSPALHWRSTDGYRLAAISMTPYVPFDRFAPTDRDDWPEGPEGTEPPADAKASSGVYYNLMENYGALGLFSAAPLHWIGLGGRRVTVEGRGELLISFPEWDGARTRMNARREMRVIASPVLLDGPALATAAPVKIAVVSPPAQAAVYYPRSSLSLDGDWELAFGEKGAGPTSEWRTVRVPGSAHTQWLPAADWYTRRAEWVSGKEWWYRKRFVIPEKIRRAPRLRLQFDATDYYADVYFNGRFAGRHEGYIDPYAYDVAGQAREGENELRVRVWTPVSYYWRNRPYTIKGSYGAVDQKPDDITALGITRSVRLVASATASIGDIGLDTRLNNDGSATVSVDVPASSGFYRATLRPRNFDGPPLPAVRVPATRARLEIHVPEPRLWWTWDHGKPNLYTLDLRLEDQQGRVLDRREMAVGIREIEKLGWTFYLNRKRMFIRGTNYYYNLFLSEMNRSAYEKDLKLMLGMNVNMIRLHCHFSNPEFYDLADEMGVLIWQDYLEAWYPHDRDFARRAAELYDNHIRYVRNHPSVAMWATSDEEDLENYRDLTKHLAARAALLDPQRRPVVRSTGRYGDAHVYHGWYEGSIWEYRQMDEAFVSELGATALPNYQSLVKFLPGAWPIRKHEADWIFHKLQIPEAMRVWGDPEGKSMEEYIPQTQAYEARLFQIAIERMRRLKYRNAGGILHFHAIDIWPSITMAAVDFYRQPTVVYDTVRRSFAPLAVLFDYEKDGWRAGETFHCGLWLVNDEWVAHPDAVVEWRLRDPDGRVVLSGRMDAPAAADSVRPLAPVDVTVPEKSGQYSLIANVVLGEGIHLDNVFSFTVTPQKGPLVPVLPVPSERP